MRYALVDENNVVVNVIEYNGSDPYTPPAGLTIKSVDDWIDIGHDADLPLPVSPVIDEAQAKEMRDTNAANDLSLVASYKMALANNPDLSFSDHMDDLESMSADIKSKAKAENNQSLPAN